MTNIEGLAFGVGLLGSVLGVINTVYGLGKERVRLVVVPKHAIPYGAMNPSFTFCLEITNLSKFAVSLETAGFLLAGSDKHAQIIEPLFAPNGSFPYRMESRTSVTIYFQRPTLNREIRCAYVKTSCGVLKTGTSPALRQIVRGDLAQI